MEVWLPNVVSYCTHRITNAVAEGINSKIIAIKRRVGGYRNPENFKTAIYFYCGGYTHNKPRWTKFFGTLNHEFLKSLISSQRFLLTQREKNILLAFLESPVLGQGEYSIPTNVRRTIGIPEGTSVSLFLANAAGSYLDEKLEQLGVGFVRYADDTLVWSNDYSSLLQAADALSDIGEELGVSVNLRKSEGISILARQGEISKMREKSAVKFIGYSISRANISMAESNVRKAKARLSQIVYRNLLQTVKNSNLIPARVNGSFDNDYLVMIYQIRRYLYGGLSEAKLRRYSSRSTARIHFKGLMSFYPIVDDEEQLKALDGWLLSTVIAETQAVPYGTETAGATPMFSYKQGRIVKLVFDNTLRGSGRSSASKFSSDGEIGRSNGKIVRSESGGEYPTDSVLQRLARNPRSLITTVWHGFDIFPEFDEDK